MENEIKENAEPIICVDIDGEKKNFDLKQAAQLCKDALEFSAAKENYRRLTDFADADSMSVPQFLDALGNMRAEKRKAELTQKCGGNEEMALHIMALEGVSERADTDKDFKMYFPDTDINELPTCVKRSAEQNNRSLIDEYLRYRALCELDAKKEAIKRKQNEISSTGSLKNIRDISFESAEFLKGLWR